MAKTLRKPFNGDYPITQLFGVNRETYLRFGLQGHDGVDYGLPTGTPVLSAVTGTVVVPPEDQGGYGKFVRVIDLDQAIETIYAHLGSILVSDGAVVQAGQQIGTSNSTGFSTGPHLHFGVREIDESLRPLNEGNGFSGYLNPLGSAFAFGEDGTTTPQGSPTGGVSTPKAPAVVTFEVAFPLIYKGWDPTAAKADFALHGQEKWQAYQQQLKEAAAPQKARPAALNKTYFLIPAFDKLSLKQISAGIPLGRPDILSNFLGIDENTPLRGGMALNVSGFPTNYYPSSGEWLGFRKLVGLDKVGVDGDWFILPQYAGMSLTDIQNSGVPFGRADILAGFLGIPQDYKIPGFQGFGIQGFPVNYWPNSGEAETFRRIFSQTAPAQTKEPVTNIPLETQQGAGKKWTGKKPPTHRDIYDLIVQLFP